MPDSSFPVPLTSSAWLAAHLGEPALAVVDASWYMAAAGRNARSEYEAGHIPGAVFWDLDALSDPGSDLPHMLPEPEALAREIGLLGIGDRDRVVVYDGSGVNQSAPRVWWTFRVMGHDAVAVLDGGLGRWRAEGRPLVSGVTVRGPARFSSRFRPAMLRSLAAVQSSLEAGTAQLLDARSRGRFEGSEPEPRPGLRGGHAPGARNLPYHELVEPDGRILPPEDLRVRYRDAGVDLSRPIVLSCGSGVTACSLALGLELLGHRNYAVYDGSWSEWGREGGPPVEMGPAGAV
jgi:thiosulfate/3-mercaptopyruvate sulfurtransferase